MMTARVESRHQVVERTAGFLRVSIVTPCRNADRYLELTLASVFDQTAVKSGRVELEYIVVDSGSTDFTTQILRRFESGALRVISERDEGMYDGLAKGLRLATGTWVSYLNAGDIYDPSAFDTLLDATANRPVRWITGS